MTNNKNTLTMTLRFLFTLILAGIISLSIQTTVYAESSQGSSVEDRIRSVDMGGLTADQFKVEPEKTAFPPFAAPKLKTKD